MTISLQTTKRLWAHSAGICAFPDCNLEIASNTTEEILGHTCHIISPKGNGPRYDPDFPEEEINKYENIILLCPNHHRIVDAQTTSYAPDKLRKMKIEHEIKIKEKLHVGKPWKYNLSQICYLNIPRLSILAFFEGTIIDLESINNFKCLHELGGDLVLLIRKFDNIIRNLHPNTIKIDEKTPINETLVGNTLEFKFNFRTKNVPTPYDCVKGTYRLLGDIFKDPHIYHFINNYKFVMSIDPKWITTSTAFCDLKRRWSYLAGLCTVKIVDLGERLIYATPLVIGTPHNDFDDIINLKKKDFLE